MVFIIPVLVFTLGCNQHQENIETSKEGKGSKMADIQKAMDFQFKMTKNPFTNTIPENARLLELEQARSILNSQDLARTNANTYTFQGPENLGGRVRSIVYDIRYDGAANSVIMAGGISGGVFKSIDGGATWLRKSPLTDHYSCTSIAQDTRAAFRDTWYYATGEAIGNSASGTGGFFFGHGIYKSTDNGATWLRLSASNTGSLETFDKKEDFITKVAVHPTTGDVYAACVKGIMRSTDGGATWAFVNTVAGGFSTTNVTDIVIASTGKLYASFAGSSGTVLDGVWSSTTGALGAWTKIAGTGAATTPATWDAAGSYGRVVLALAPSLETKLYVLYSKGSSSCAGVAAPEAKLFIWDDLTTTWSDRSASLPDDPGCLDGNDPFANQGGYDLVIAVKPDNDSTVYIGGTNAYRSTNGFRTTAFNKRIGGYASPASYASYASSHADIHAFAFQPTSSIIMLCGNDGGIQKTTDNTATTVAWTNISSGFRTYQYYYVAIDPRIGNTKVMGGAQDNGTTRNTGGAGTSFESVWGGDGVSVGLTDLISGVQYEIVGSQEGEISRRASTLSSGFGTSIRPTAATAPGAFVTLFLLDPDNTTKLYYANTSKIYRTASSSTVTTGGWTDMTGISTKLGAGEVSALATTRGTYSTASNLFIGTDDAKLYRIADPSAVAAATAPTEITGASFPAAGFVSSISVNPRNDDTVLITFSNYGVTSVFWTGTAKSATPTWHVVEGTLTLPSYRSSAIVVNGATVEYYVGTSVGIYRATIDGSAPASTAWAQESSAEIGNAIASHMVLRTSDNNLLVGTHGYGMWRTAIASLLPVNFISFIGNTEKRNNVLKWSVANEINNEGYYLERRYKNEAVFSSAGFIPAKANNNNSATYSYTDNTVNLTMEQTFYRLKQIDKDGKFSYSNVVLLTRTPSGKLVEYLSADANNLFIRINNITGEKISVRISSINGKQMYRNDVMAVNMNIPVGSWRPGTYVAEVWNDGKRAFIQQFIKP